MATRSRRAGRSVLLSRKVESWHLAWTNGKVARPRLVALIDVLQVADSLLNMSKILVLLAHGYALDAPRCFICFLVNLLGLYIL